MVPLQKQGLLFYTVPYQLNTIKHAKGEGFEYSDDIFFQCICLCLFSMNSRSNDCATALNAVPLNFLGQGHLLNSETPEILLTVSAKLQNSHHAASSVCVCLQIHNVETTGIIHLLIFSIV